MGSIPFDCFYDFWLRVCSHFTGSMGGCFGLLRLVVGFFKRLKHRMQIPSHFGSNIIKHDKYQKAGISAELINKLMKSDKKLCLKNTFLPLPHTPQTVDSAPSELASATLRRPCTSHLQRQQQLPLARIFETIPYHQDLRFPKKCFLKIVHNLKTSYETT